MPAKRELERCCTSICQNSGYTSIAAMFLEMTPSRQAHPMAVTEMAVETASPRLGPSMRPTAKSVISLALRIHKARDGSPKDGPVSTYGTDSEIVIRKLIPGDIQSPGSRRPSAVGVEDPDPHFLHAVADELAL
ncbi:MAG: hypothetical protein OXF07_14575, partial [Rhodobacter sp.]|nr:hypothetical protein [Rhodobacter sp.]